MLTQLQIIKWESGVRSQYCSVRLISWSFFALQAFAQTAASALGVGVRHQSSYVAGSYGRATRKASFAV
jgi:hypothetical protein